MVLCMSEMSDPDLAILIEAGFEELVIRSIRSRGCTSLVVDRVQSVFRRRVFRISSLILDHQCLKIVSGVSYHRLVAIHVSDGL